MFFVGFSRCLFAAKAVLWGNDWNEDYFLRLFLVEVNGSLDF